MEREPLTPSQLAEIRAGLEHHGPGPWALNTYAGAVPLLLAEIDRLNAALSASLEYQGQLEVSSDECDRAINAACQNRERIVELEAQLRHAKADADQAIDDLKVQLKSAHNTYALNNTRLAELSIERLNRIGALEADLAAATADNPICEPTAKGRPQSDPPRNGKRHVWVEESRWQQALAAERRIADLEAANARLRAAMAADMKRMCIEVIKRHAWPAGCRDHLIRELEALP